MARILTKEVLAPDVVRFWIDTPVIARKRHPGQFVIIRTHEGGERIPLTVADVDTRAGAISLVVQGVGKSTRRLNQMAAGDDILDVAGPLGRPTVIEPGSRVCCIGGGIGTAVVYPIAAATRHAGSQVSSIIGARTLDLVILEKELGAVSDRLVVATNDGSYGMHGLVTDALQRFLTDGLVFDTVVAVGPLPMMRAVCELTRPLGLHTLVSLNPVMVDGTGMCGGCRVTVNGEQKFVCVDGPEFNGHHVNFEEIAARLASYTEDEAQSLRLYEDERAAASEWAL